MTEELYVLYLFIFPHEKVDHFISDIAIKFLAGFQAYSGICEIVYYSTHMSPVMRNLFS